MRKGATKIACAEVILLVSGAGDDGSAPSLGCVELAR